MTVTMASRDRDSRPYRSLDPSGPGYPEFREKAVLLGNMMTDCGRTWALFIFGTFKKCTLFSFGTSSRQPWGYHDMMGYDGI